MTALSYRAHRDAIAAGRFLRVINYHNTPASGRQELRRELGQLATHYRVLTLEDLDRFFDTGLWDSDQPGFLPVFYEGYRNGYDVAAEVCDEIGITGWFAICTGFVDCPTDEQEVFARAHWIHLHPEELGRDRVAMSWDEVADLSTRHVVFPHTASHAGIDEVITDDDLHREIVAPKQRMDEVTGQSAAAFAWLGGTPWTASAQHDAAVCEAGYRYLVSNTMIHRIA